MFSTPPGDARTDVPEDGAIALPWPGKRATPPVSSDCAARPSARSTGRFGGLLVLAIVAGVLPFGAAAADQPLTSELFNWYYATAFGTGAYRIADQTVTVLSAPITYMLRPPSDEKWGVRVTVPVTAALANFHYQDLDFADTTVAGMSILPGVEWMIVPRPNWMVRPFVGLGYGTEFQSETGATIYQVGVTSAYQVPDLERWRVSLGMKLIYAGYVSNDGGGLPLSGLSVGAGSAFPLDWNWDGHKTWLGFQLIGTSYFNDLEFLVPGSGVQEIRNEYEIGVSLNIDPPVALLGATFDRLGLGYRRGSGGLQGIHLVTEFPF
jgi:hypothetical protein